MILSEELIHWLEQEYATTMSETFAKINSDLYMFNSGKLAMIDIILGKSGKQLAVGLKAQDKPPEKK